MPLATSPDPADVTLAANGDAEYLIFYSSVDATNQMWCPDCRRVEDAVRRTFEPEDAPSALIVFVGQQDDWKGKPNNPFRRSPWHVDSVPTILRKDGARLVGDEIDEEALGTFTKA